MVIVHGVYNFKKKLVGFRNDYCMRCQAQRRAVQLRMFNVVHIFWIPLVPLGFWKQWICTVCGKNPHETQVTRRGFKWAGLMVLLFIAVVFWMIPPEAGWMWALRIILPIASATLLIYLLRTPGDVSLKERLATVQPATDMTCPFCAAPLMVGDRCYCPGCGAVRY
jgi:hypothetical protein